MHSKTTVCKSLTHTSGLKKDCMLLLMRMVYIFGTATQASSLMAAPPNGAKSLQLQKLRLPCRFHLFVYYMENPVRTSTQPGRLVSVHRAASTPSNHCQCPKAT